MCNKLRAGRLCSISTLHVGLDQPDPRPNPNPNPNLTPVGGLEVGRGRGRRAAPPGASVAF